MMNDIIKFVKVVKPNVKLNLSNAEEADYVKIYNLLKQLKEEGFNNPSLSDWIDYMEFTVRPLL